MKYPALPWLALLLLAELAFGLACRLVPPPGDPARGQNQSSLASRFFTASRTGLGAGAIQQADLYLHRGVEHVRQEAFRDTWFHRMGSRVAMHGVMHREGEESREVVPWLWFGTTLDPDNLNYSLMSSYWLKTAGRDDLAVGVVRQALGRHPREPRLHFEHARLLLRGGRFAQAACALDAAITCARDDHRPDASSLMSALRTYRGLLYEYEGNSNAAVVLFGEGKEQTPDIRDRALDLRNNRTPAQSAATLLSNLVHVAFHCDNHEDHDDGHGEDHEGTRHKDR